MKWKTLHELKDKNKKLTTDNIQQILLENRGLITPKDQKIFLHPSFESVTPVSLSVNSNELKKSITRINHAIQSQELIVVYGDYDVDGVSGTCILYESLRAVGANVLPYIPNRMDQGYGLSQKGIDYIRSEEKSAKVGMIITVDNGILAHEAIDYANTQHIDVIVTDHHELPDVLPSAYAIIHTMAVCGSGVAWLLASAISGDALITDKYLDVLALATIADLMPLRDINRTIVKYGITALQSTTRPGLRALYKEADIDPQKIDTYTIGHIIAPRINAMGRLESAIDSLRLLCTKDMKRAADLAHLLGETNRGRQLLTQAATMHAVEKFKAQNSKLKNILILESDYEEGIIGLVAGKLVETFDRPAIVLSIGPEISKASARSISGFNIIEFIRLHESLLINAGGHMMAAGFTIETKRIPEFRSLMENAAEKLESENTEKELVVDCPLPIDIVDQKLFNMIDFFSPFGNANPEPLFTSAAIVKDCKIIGKDGRHIKLSLQGKETVTHYNGIGFGLAEICKKLKSNDEIQIAYSVQENVWNGRKSLQLLVKDVHP